MDKYQNCESRWPTRLNEDKEHNRWNRRSKRKTRKERRRSVHAGRRAYMWELINCPLIKIHSCVHWVSDVCQDEELFLDTWGVWHVSYKCQYLTCITHTNMPKPSSVSITGNFVHIIFLEFLIIFKRNDYILHEDK